MAESGPSRTGAGVVMAGVVPHPPIMVPEVGGREADKVRATAEAVEALGREIAESGAESLVIISPHAPSFSDAVPVIDGERLHGDLGAFNARSVRLSLDVDQELVGAIVEEGRGAGLTCLPVTYDDLRGYGFSRGLDHGVIVPMYFLQRGGVDLPVVVIGLGMFPLVELYRFGMGIARAAEGLGRRVAVVASGDLSHRLTPDAPAGYNPRGREFDEYIVEKLEEGDVRAIVGIDRDLAEDAGECGLRPIVITLGALEGVAFSAEKLAYQGPFGVGYSVFALRPQGRDHSRELFVKLLEERGERVRAARAKESAPVRLARETVEAYVRYGVRMSPPEEPLPGLPERAGVFCSIKKHGELRGCIGTVVPVYPTVAEEIIHNAIAAATEDPRFDPVSVEELDDLVYSVDVLGEPEPVRGPDRFAQLDPKVYGVIVRRGFRQGVLLPDLPGIDTPEEQVEIACRKAGIDPRSEFEIQRFTVTRYH